MRYKDLTNKDKEYIKHVYFSNKSHKDKTDILSKKFNIGERSVRRWWENLGLKKLLLGLPKQLEIASNKCINDDTKVLLITSAQNKTTINSDMFSNIKLYRDYIENTLNKKCEILIIPTRYRNPTSIVEDSKAVAEDWWEYELDSYLIYGKVMFGDTLISADSRISPTAKDPLTGYELLANTGHLILPHSKVHFKTLPRLRGDSLRVMCTTGYITNRNYSDSKAGEVAFENHSNSFVVVELKTDDTCYIPRNVKVNKDGSFTDLIYDVKNNTVSVIDSSEAFIWGDLHSEVINSVLYDITKQLVKDVFKPKAQVLNDVFDGSTVNPHEEKDLFIKRQKITSGKHLIEEELERTMAVVKEIKSLSEKTFIIESNHDVFLDRHINSFNWKNDLHNSPTYLKLSLIQQSVDLRNFGNLFGYLLSERFGNDVKYIKMGNSLKIMSYQCGLHGDFGVNGSKGNSKGFNRMNTKMIHAHTHSPMIFNNVTCVGVTCETEQYYNRKGFSSWAYAHSVIHSNGKNQLLVFGDDLSLSSLI